MGLNLIRYVTDEQYRAIKWYKWTKHSTPLDQDYPDAVGGTVLDFGGFGGAFSLRCEAELRAKVFCYEPVREFHKGIIDALPPGSQIVLRPFGVAATNRTSLFDLRGEGSAESSVGHEKCVAVELRAIDEVILEDAPLGVDLMAMNIEGAEFEVLPHLAQKNLMKLVRHLRVQFHPNIPGARAKYDEVSKLLSQTHELKWRYPFFWESWSIKRG